MKRHLSTLILLLFAFSAFGNGGPGKEAVDPSKNETSEISPLALTTRSPKYTNGSVVWVHPSGTTWNARSWANSYGMEIPGLYWSENDTEQVNGYPANKYWYGYATGIDPVYTSRYIFDGAYTTFSSITRRTGGDGVSTPEGVAASYPAEKFSVPITAGGWAELTFYEFVYKWSNPVYEWGMLTYSTKTKQQLSSFRVKKFSGNILATNSRTMCQGQSVNLTEFVGTHGAPVAFYDPSGNPLYSSIVYPATGTQIYRAKVFFANGYTLTEDITLTVVAVSANAGADQTVCINGGNIGLVGTPTGGTWSGTGVSGSTFYPVTAGVGSHTLTYTRTVSGCTARDTKIITVNNAPSVNWSAVPDQCTSNGSVYLGTYFGSTLSGGTVTYSGHGVSGSYFYPATAGAGSFTITGTQTVNGCTDSETTIIDVYAAPSFTFDDLPAKCTADGVFDLQVYTSIYTDFSGPGVSNNTFQPSSAGAGTHTITASGTSNGCTTTMTKTITVTAEVYASAGADMKVGKSNTSFNLSGTPSGGTWSGSPYVTSAGSFTPSAVGIYNLTYSYSSGTCSDSDVMTLEVVSVDAPSTSVSTSHCFGGGDITYYASGAGSGQTYRWYTDISGGTPFHTTPSFTIFTPTTTTYYVSVYDASVNVESGRTSVTGVVKDAVPVPVITGATAACGITTVTLNASNGVVNAEFDWYESASSTTSLFSGADYSFSVNKTMTVWVESYDPAKGCLSERISYTINYGEVPYAPEGESVIACGGGEATLTARGADANETYSWYEVQYGGLELHSGSTYTTTVNSDRYFYVSKRNLTTGCESPRIRLSVDFRELPVVTAGTSITACFYDPEFALTGGSPTYGQWSGPGVVSSTYFKASLAGEGTHTLTYSYTDEFGCSASATRTVTVLPAPNTPVTENVSICGEGSVVLTASGANGELGEDYFWYEFSSSTAQIGQGETFEAYANFSTTYYVAIRASSGCESPRKAVKVNVIDLPAAPVAQDVARCGIGEVTLTASGAPADGGIKWFESENSDIVYHEGPSFVYYAEASRSFFVAAYNSSGCLSQRREVAVTVGANINVDAGPDFNICKSEERIYLSEGSPAGGYWSGPGVGGGYFDPSGVAAGEHILTYNYQGTYCTASDTRIVRVYDTQVVSAGPDKELCHTSNKLNLLSEASVQSATFIGNGVSGISFDPALSGAGSHLVTMVYLNENGCESRDSRIITVILAEEVTVGSDFSTCLSGEPVDLMVGVSKTGGVWSGSGVTNNTFDPAAAMDGQHLLTYRVGDSQGCESIATKTATVRAPVLVDAGSVIGICQTAPMFEITGASPAGGYYEGLGVVGGTTLDPSLLPVGQNMIDYHYTDQYGCTSTDQRVINIVAPPVVSAGDDKEMCFDSAPIQLVGNPSGGSWAGNGISADGVFTPEIAGVGIANLVYSYSSIYGCTVSDNVAINVLAQPEYVSAGGDMDLCLESTPVSLTGALPEGGQWFGLGLNAEGKFDPALVGTGTFLLEYRVTNAAGCSRSDFKEIRVRKAASVYPGPTVLVCESADIFDLTGASPSGGYYEGVGVVGGTAIDPSLLPVGQNMISYIYEDGFGCIATATRIINITEKPVVSAGDDFSRCISAAPNQLTGQPTGGFWVGNGISADGVFTPELAGIGIHELFYNYESIYGCTVIDIVEVEVLAEPAFTVGSDISLCVEAPAYNLEAAVSPVGGLFQGPGVSGGLFYASRAGVGVHEITYSYQTETGCNLSGTRSITVTEVPELTVGTDKSLCVDSPSIDLNADGVSHAGGRWSGPGVLGSSFYPSTVETGSHIVTYTVNFNGCSNSVERVIDVNEPPVLDLGAETEIICQQSGLLNLAQFPNISGGVWEGAGVEGNFLNVNNLSPGYYALIYRIDDYLGCSLNKSKGFQVVESPALTFTDVPKSLCVQAQAINLNKYVNLTGGIFEGAGINGTNFTPAEAGIGLHIIEYTYTNGYGCSTTQRQVIEVTENVDVNAGNDLSLCIGFGGYDMANHGAFPAGGIFTGTGVRNNIFDPSLSGTGNFTISYLYDHGNGCIGTDNIIITVTPSEITDFGSDEVHCINSSEVILNFSTELEGGNWEGNGVVDNIFYPNLAGTGVHELTYRNENFSCEIAGKRKLSVVDLPELPIMTMESVEGCINEPVKLEAKLPEGSAQNNLQVAWFREDGTFLDYGSSIEHVVTVNENIYFSTVNRFGCESSREQFVRIIARKPSGDFYANKTQLAFGSYVKFSTEGLVNAVGFEWDFGDGTKSYERDPYKYYYASDSFDIALTLTSAAGCKTVIRKENYMVVFQEDGGEAEGFLTGISDKDIEEGSVLLYPNPVYNSFKLKFTKATVVSKMNVKVYDLLGVVHYESQIMVSSGNDEFSIDVNSLALAPGQYYVVLQSENDSETLKFIKQ